jgi:hypothetical protein
MPDAGMRDRSTDCHASSAVRKPFRRYLSRRLDYKGDNQIIRVTRLPRLPRCPCGSDAIAEALKMQEDARCAGNRFCSQSPSRTFARWHSCDNVPLLSTHEKG